jgi:hypothetical protein
MPRAPKQKTTTIANQLVNALKFISLADHDKGTPNETHCILTNNWAQAYDGVIAASIPIQENITAIPHTSLLLSALSKCGQNLSVTQLDANRISIKSDKFRAIVPCLDSNFLSMVAPDPPIALVSNALKLALETVAFLAKDSSDNVIEASILMKEHSVIATDRALLLEAWHGIDLPPGIVLPKATVTALCKSVDKLTTFGFSNNTITFYFENRAWLRSSRYSDNWPDLHHLLDLPCNMQPIPKDFFAGVDAIEAFAHNDVLSFQENLLCAQGADGGVSASYEVVGLQPGPRFSAKRLKIIAPHCQFADFFVDRKMIFCGNNVRGILCGMGR